MVWFITVSSELSLLRMRWRCFASCFYKHFHNAFMFITFGRSSYPYRLAKVPCCLLEQKKKKTLLVQVIDTEEQDLIDCAVHHVFVFALMSRTELTFTFTSASLFLLKWPACYLNAVKTFSKHISLNFCLASNSIDYNIHMWSF